MVKLPEGLLRDLKDVRGYDEDAFITAHTFSSLTSVRLNPGKPAVLFPEAENVPWNNLGRYLAQRPVFTLDPAYHAGAYYVQEASSMFLGHLLEGVFKGKTRLRVLDLCAAPGGKSTLLASMLDKDSLLISNEVIRTRASILEENMTRWGHSNTWVTSNDPRDFSKLAGYFDVIVVDAPCSGSGLFRKDERAVDEWSEANVALCRGRQERILEDVWPSLKEGGVLVYATCSYSPQEDEGVLDWVASNYEVSSIRTSLDPEWGIVESEAEKGLVGYRFFPDKVKGEGFFIAAIRKNDEAGTPDMNRFKTAHNSKIFQQAEYLLHGSNWTVIPVGKDEYSAINPLHEQDLQILQKAVYLRRTGLNLGMPAQKEWLPAHEVALGIDAAKDLPHLEVSREDALRFLKREDMGQMQKGWLIIKYNGLGLGWIKSLGNRANNYLPKQWRIRMELG